MGWSLLDRPTGLGIQTMRTAGWEALPVLLTYVL